MLGDKPGASASFKDFSSLASCRHERIDRWMFLERQLKQRRVISAIYHCPFFTTDQNRRKLCREKAWQVAFRALLERLFDRRRLRTHQTLHGKKQGEMKIDD